MLAVPEHWVVFFLLALFGILLYFAAAARPFHFLLHVLCFMRLLSLTRRCVDPHSEEFHARELISESLVTNVKEVCL
jgi:hypothetical protein